MKAYFYTLVAILFATISLSAQTVWLGNTDSDWQNSDNWSAGVPTAGMTITIPGNPAGGNFPVFSGGPIIDYTIQNAGTLTFNSLVYNNGTIINFGGGIINNDGSFFNAGMGVFDNDGILNNNATFTNYGTFDLALSGGVNVAVGATYTHAGLFFKAAGPFLNYGTTINASNMRCTNVFENFGVLENKNSFEAPFGSIFKNHSNGTISNPSGSLFVVNGEFTNNAPFTNGGEFQIQSATDGTSTATITNNGMLDVSGSLVNESSIINNSTLAIKDGGTLTNNNTVTNNGLVTLSICGALVQNANNTIVAPVQNDGLIYLLNGDVEWTNIEFGNEFTDINATKPPVAGCLPGIFVSLDANGTATVQASQVDKGSYGSCGASLSSVSIDRTDFTEADLGSNLVTLTIVDNIGIASSCQSIVTILPYVAPVVPIDNADITFDCPEDVFVSTLPGGTSAVATWTVPTQATSNCTSGAATCTARTTSNTTQCNNGNVYQFYLSLDGQNRHYQANNGTFTEYEDGTANYSATIVNSVNSSYEFDVSINFSGRTSSAPVGSPKSHSCGNYDTSNWYYYPTTSGTMIGKNALQGATIAVTRAGESFQVGNGANITSNNGNFGGSGWLDVTILTQPDNGPSIALVAGANSEADINIMLSGTGSDCQSGGQCSDVQNFSGFTFMGEFNNSKYYCSTTNNFTWAEAKVAAENIGGYLAIPNDLDENTFLQNNILADWAWLGITDEASEGNFVDVFGNSATYLNWNSGEPNNSGAIEHYARILKSNGKWTDRDQHFQAEVVVEIPCSSGSSCEDVSVEVTFDSYPEDISWQLKDAAGEVMAEGNNYGGEPDNSTITQTVCLPDGCYDFVISDSYGDGLCCQYGNGSYVVKSADGTLLVSGASFTSQETTNFCLGNNNGGGGPAGPPTISQIGGPQNGDAFAVGITEVAYEITDDCGNQEICIFEVTVDQTPSEITFDNCPGDITINTEAGATSAPVTWTPVTATTTCFNDGLEIEQALGPNIGDIQRVKDGPQLVVYNAIDSCGNFNVCSFNITVIATPSSISIAGCSGDINEIAAPGASSTSVSWDVPTGSTDCFTGVVNVDQLEGPASGSEFEVGTSTRIIYLVSDECGNTEICIFFVVVEESCPAAGTACDDGDFTTINDQEDGNCNCAGVPATITVTNCSNDLVFETEPGASTAIVTFQSPGFSTDCTGGTSGNVQQISGGASGTAYPVGVTTVEFIFSDNCGNIESCSFDVTVIGIACTDMDGDGICAADDCDDNDANLPAAQGTACDDGDATTENDVIGVDGCNCSGTLIGEITLDCPADILLDPVPGNIVTYDWPQPTGTSNCPDGGFVITQISGPAPGTQLLANDSGITIVYEATDACGNSTTCSFVVTDQFWNATFEYTSCPIDIVVQATSADGAIVNYSEPVLFTDCPDGASNSLSSGLASGSLFPVGITEITYQAIGNGVANGCGGGTSCFFTVTVEEYISDPCEALGGDADGDGVCAADDCDDNDANLPAAQGTACDDGDAMTENDVIGADGCSCTGTIIDPCSAAGGDMDGDGICAADDCDDNDANLPAAQGTACDDGDVMTENDVIGADGCSCAGTPISSDPDCTDIDITGGVGEVVVEGLIAPITSIQVFNSQWQEEFKCFANCDAPIQTIDGLTEGTYFVKVAFYTSSYQLICAIEDYYSVLGGDPCANAGGDADGDGVCAVDDCDDNDASLPAAPGTACDDGDANTVNDVIGADGCSCAGSDPADPCATAGGDADGDGVCAADDCDDNNASLPAMAGTACDDGDSNTTNDEIQADGCTCEGVTSGPDCGIISIVADAGFISVSNLDEAPISSVQIYDASWSEAFKCAGDCNATEVVSNLAPGTYFVKVALYSASWQLICAVEDYYTVTGGSGDPCAALGGDADGDGVCADLDCDDNDINFPMAVGTACDDGNPETVQDAILADGCTCEGKIHNPSDTDCSNITITAGDGSLTVDGLSGAPITSIQIFDESWRQVYKCAGDCDSETQIIDGLTTGTYFVKVSFYDAAWQLQCATEDFYPVDGAAPSPRRLLDFNVQKGPRQVEIMWGSNTGLINDHFTIERSADGVTYEEILTVNNKFENDAFNTYLEKDLEPLSGMNYYRMKQVYDDGTYIYSGNRMVIFEGDFTQLSIFPNPTSDQVYIHLKSFSGLPVTIQFYDALGRIVMERSLRSAPEVPLPFNTTDLNEGSYIVSIKYLNRKMVSERLVIIKQ